MLLPDFLTQDDQGSIRLQGHRIGLHHLLHYYKDGYSPEMLWCEYPDLSLAMIHKSIAFYLENQVDVDEYLGRCEKTIQVQKDLSPQSLTFQQLKERFENRPKVQGA